MIAKASRYSLPIARIRAAMSDLLGACEYAMLLHAPSLDAMMAALRTTAYAPALRAADPGFATAVRGFRLSRAERLVGALPADALALCRTFLSRFELEALKVILRAVVSGAERRRTLSMLQPMPAHPVLPIKRLLAARTLEDAARALAGTPYAAPLTEGLKSATDQAVGARNAPSPLSEVEAHLDRLFLTRMARASDAFSGEERTIVRRLVGLLIDVNNVLWTERLRRTFHLAPEAVARRLCPAGFYFDSANKRATLARWDGHGQPPFVAVGLEEAGGPLRISLMRMLAREARRPLFAIPFQAGVALGYLVTVDLETADLVALYEGRRWGRDPMQLADMLIRFHGAALAGGEGA
jgi:vacuolar-type H+-ATPase subunit C/Vma6